MRNGEGYKTKQRTLIEDCLKTIGERHVTVDELTELLSDKGESVGRTTVYRCLEKMSKEGRLRKYTLGTEGSTCYQYIPEDTHCHEHYHLKCEKCGRLIHVECESIESLFGHIQSDHDFSVDSFKTVIYGTCKDCAIK